MVRSQVIVATEEDLHDRIGHEKETSDPQSGTTWSDSLFESLFLQHYERVVLALFRLLGERGRAEELANDVFWKLYRQPLEQGREHNLGGWLYRTAMNLGMDCLRAETRRKRYEQIAGLNRLKSDVPANPLDELFRSEKRQQVRNVLARMKPAQAQILILRSSGLSYKELAEVLNVGASSIGTLLVRAETEFENLYCELFGDRG
jgi:RNA polymerase sigma-70 factor, ECF subfamily